MILATSELENRLRDCAELHARDVPVVPDLNRRIIARLQMTPRAERARPSLKRELLLSAAVAAGILALAIAVTAGVRAHLLQSPGPVKQSSSPSVPPVTTAFTIQNIQFISPQVGWLNESGNTPAGPSAVYRTTDGGKHWQEQLHWDGPGAEQMLFDGQDGIVVGMGGVPLFRTTDAGAHWQRLTLPPMLQAESSNPIYFRSPTEGWIMGFVPQTYSDAACAPGGCPLMGLFHTSDGGKSWSETATLKPLELFPGGRMPGQLEFSDALNGWLVGGDVSANQGALYATHDGGRTWSAVRLTVPALGQNQSAMVNQAPHFFNSRDGVLIIQTAEACQPPACSSAQVPPSAFLYKTNDGGEHWTAPAPLPVGDFGPGGIFYLDPDHYWLVAGSTVASSIDGGQHWSLHQNAVSPQLFLSQPDFQSVDAGWAVAISATQLRATQLVYTTDGGAHWAPVKTPALSR